MLYQAYQTYHDASEPVRAMARATLDLANLVPGFTAMGFGQNVAAMLEMTARTKLTHHRPEFGIDRVKVGHRDVAVFEETVLSLPFCDIVRFGKDGIADQPKMLVIAPLSGHFATLLRQTVQTMLRDHEVYITDWKNARDVPLMMGRFGLDEYVDYIIEALETVGPDAHLFAVCQPCVQALAAVAVMAQEDHPAQPRSMTLMAGPIDTRIDPTTVNELATSKPIEWFEKNLICRVPMQFQGRARKVYPGFLQLSAFMSMNMERHTKAHHDLYTHLASGDGEAAESIKRFYDEYCAVLDMPAEFYLETVQDVFQEAKLARGKMMYRNRKVNPAAIRRTALLTIEGERDDICSVGQTAAAHDLCSSLRPHMKRHHLQPDVGHYGTFSGKRWNRQIYPVIQNVVLSNS